MGQFEEAASIARAGMQFAEEYDQPISTLMALWGTVEIAVIRGRFEEAMEAIERAAELCKRWGFKLFYLWTTVRLGHVYALSSRVLDAIAVLEDAVPAAAALPGAGFHSLAVRCLGEPY
ncbi:MAG: ATP/maltotriose-dependent transcriptional regulator MalT [Gammaproteobacteria bacterium]